VFLELSESARRIFALPAGTQPGDLRFLDLSPMTTNEHYSAHTLNLAKRSAATPSSTVIRLGPDHALAPLIPVSGEAGLPGHFDGIIEDITARQQADTERDILLQEYHSSLLFLSEPLANTASSLLRCPMHTPVLRARKCSRARRPLAWRSPLRTAMKSSA